MTHLPAQYIWEAPDDSFTKVIITKGFTFHSPQEGSLCRIKIHSDPDGVIGGCDEAGEREIIIGEADTEVDRVLESCVRTMKDGEICDITFPMPRRLADGKAPKTSSLEEDESIKAKPASEETAERSDGESSRQASLEDEEEKPPEADDSVEAKPKVHPLRLQLLTFISEPEIWEMSITEKWRRATHHKDNGVQLYSRGRYYWAFHRFSKSLKYLISLEQDIPPDSADRDMDIQSFKFSSYSNLAACQLKHFNYDGVVKNCTKALEIRPGNTKALYRRGLALVQLQEYEKAQADLHQAAKNEPRNLSIAKQQQILKAKLQKLNKHYANAMKKMFT